MKIVSIVGTNTGGAQKSSFSAVGKKKKTKDI
jgi:hypothetical protein